MGPQIRLKTESEEPTPTLGAPLHGEQRCVKRNVRPALHSAADEAGERIRLERAIQTIDAFKARIRTLERSEQRLKKQVKEEKDRLKDCKADAEGTLSLMVLAEEKVCELEAVIAELRQDVDRYRRWWLTEYYSLRALLALLPNDSQQDVKHIAESAHARFATFSRRL